MLTINYLFPGGEVISLNPEHMLFDDVWVQVQAEYFKDAIFFYTVGDVTTDVWDEDPFDLTREKLAQLLAAHTSGFRDAVPEKDDFDLADVVLRLVEKELGRGR